MWWPSLPWTGRTQQTLPITKDNPASETESDPQPIPVNTNVAGTHFFITNVHLAHSDPHLAKALWAVECYEGEVVSVTLDAQKKLPRAYPWYELDAQGSIMLPSLCHSHIHLDKCFLLDQCGDLVSGDFQEAMKLTGAAKQKFALSISKPDMLRRGRKLVRESVECGVTSLRAHVEIDTLAVFSGLNIARHLKAESHSACYIQIAAFAQEALFQTAGTVKPNMNYDLLAEAVKRNEVEVVGSAPYVEPSIEQAKMNIALILDLAARHSLHADFHLDYNLDPNSEPLIYEVIAQARKYRYWIPENGLCKRRITIGHATRLQLFTPAQWRDLAEAIGELPITIVGLPNSDMYMQGREYTDELLGAPRGTLRVPYIATKYGFQIAMSVNNIENAFTPQGSVDPLALCTFGAAVFQSATVKDIRTLMRSVTITSKLAIGQPNLPLGLCPQKGDPADFVILHGTNTLQQAALNPGYDRTTIRNGIVVARRRTKKWISYSQAPLTRIIIPWYKQLGWWWFATFPVSWPYLMYRYVTFDGSAQVEYRDREGQDAPMMYHDPWDFPPNHRFRHLFTSFWRRKSSADT